MTEPNKALPTEEKRKRGRPRKSPLEKGSSKYEEKKMMSIEQKRQSILAGETLPLPCVICNDVTERIYIGEWQPNEEQHKTKNESDKDKKKSGQKKSKEIVEKISEEVSLQKKYWLKCSVCNQVELFEEWRIQVNKKAKSIDSINEKESIPYDVNSIYAIGDVVFHAKFNKVGIVRSKEYTASGQNIVLVEFKELGIKSLLENLKKGLEPKTKQEKKDNLQHIKKKLKLKLKLKKNSHS